MNSIPVIQIDNVLISLDVIEQEFCCDLDICHGECCVEGESGAPVTMDEVSEMENALDTVWQDMSASAQAVVDKQGVAYTDDDGDLVSSIVGGKDCVFTCYHDGCCLCSLEKAFREGKTKWCKPISCALYPIRESRLKNGMIALNYHRWAVCDGARRKGHEIGLPVYQFLKEPLTRRFGADWYKALEEAAEEIKK